MTPCPTCGSLLVTPDGSCPRCQGGVAATYSNAPELPPVTLDAIREAKVRLDEFPSWTLTPSFGGSLFGALQDGWKIVPDRHLRPFQERERSRDGSCLNLSAVSRNRERRIDASKLYVMKAERTIFCAPHMVEEIEKAFAVSEQQDVSRRVTDDQVDEMLERDARVAAEMGAKLR